MRRSSRLAGVCFKFKEALSSSEFRRNVTKRRPFRDHGRYVDASDRTDVVRSARCVPCVQVSQAGVGAYNGGLKIAIQPVNLPFLLEAS